MPDNELKIHYLPAIGIVEENGLKKADFFWSDDPRDLNTVDTFIVHSMFNQDGEGDEQFSAQACRDVLNEGGFSSHYLIDRIGKIFQTVDEVRQAWHAGKSKMPLPDGRTGVNRFSVSTELLGNKTDGFTQEQYVSLVGLIVQIMDRLPIRNIVGHSDIAGRDVRPDDPKTDPWYFDWPKFVDMLRAGLTPEKFDQIRIFGGEFKPFVQSYRNENYVLYAQRDANGKKQYFFVKEGLTVAEDARPVALPEAFASYVTSGPHLRKQPKK